MFGFKASAVRGAKVLVTGHTYGLGHQVAHNRREMRSINTNQTKARMRANTNQAAKNVARMTLPKELRKYVK